MLLLYFIELSKERRIIPNVGGALDGLTCDVLLLLLDLVSNQVIKCKDHQLNKHTCMSMLPFNDTYHFSQFFFCFIGRRKGFGHRCILDHLESSGTKIMMSGTAVMPLYKRENRERGNKQRRSWGGLYMKPPKFEHIFVAVITFFSFLLCRYF